MKHIRTIKGTHDILPDTSKDWQNLEKIIFRVILNMKLMRRLMSSLTIMNLSFKESQILVTGVMNLFQDGERYFRKILLIKNMTRIFLFNLLKFNYGESQTLRRNKFKK